MSLFSVLFSAPKNWVKLDGRLFFSSLLPPPVRACGHRYPAKTGKIRAFWVAGRPVLAGRTNCHFPLLWLTSPSPSTPALLSSILPTLPPSTPPFSSEPTCQGGKTKLFKLRAGRGERKETSEHDSQPPQSDAFVSVQREFGETTLIEGKSWGGWPTPCFVGGELDERNKLSLI